MQTVSEAVVDRKSRTARKASSARPDINAGAAEYERKQREEIIEALTTCQGRVGGSEGAAIRLGINRITLMYRMRKLGIYAKLYSWIQGVQSLPGRMVCFSYICLIICFRIRATINFGYWIGGIRRQTSLTRQPLYPPQTTDLLVFCQEVFGSFNVL